MPELDAKAIYKKHVPSTFQFFFRGGLILIVFWFGVGFGLGLQLAIFPIIALCLHYVFMLFRAKKLADAEIADLHKHG